MKITDNILRRTDDLVHETDAKSSGAASSSEKATEQSTGEDTVSVSNLSKTLAKVSDALAEDEARRSERVQDLKQQVSAGTYSVSSTDVAESIIREAAEAEGDTNA